jgi:ABC-2 type transport system permease protein
MSARAHATYARALVATNMKATLALRAAFWMQAIFMLANNVVFFTVWVIFFDRFESIGGWRLGEMALLYGIVAGAFGLTVVVAGGVRDLPRAIVDGDLDAWLAQPKHPLFAALGCRSIASGWGDLVSAVALIVLSGVVTPATAVLALVGVLCGAIVFASTGVLVASLAFWLGPMENLARQLWEFVIVFSVYPQTIFGGAMRVLLFTVIPAGFIGYLPVELVRGFSLGGLAAVLGGAFLYGALAVAVFRAGLRRYESGNRFGVRA